MCANSVPILVFLGLSVGELGPMYATDRRQTDRLQTEVRQKHPLMPPPYGVGGVITQYKQAVREAATICPHPLQVDR